MWRLDRRTNERLDFVGDSGEGDELGETGVGLLDEPLQEREDEFGFGFAQNSIIR